MNSNDARLRINRVLRDGEQTLVFEEALALPYTDPELRMISGSRNAPVWVAVTPARLIEVGSNDHITSARWADMASLGVHKAGRKWQYQWQHHTQRIPYAPIQVSQSFAELLQGIQAGRVPLSALPEETTTYTVEVRSHDDSALGRTAAAMGLPEKQCICDACGSTVGMDKPHGSECWTCHRVFREQ